MRHIDAFCHFFPPALFERMSQTVGGTQDIGKRMQGVRTIYDLDARLRMMDEFGDDYSEILSLGLPPLDAMAGPENSPELARIANDGLAELCAKYPDRFSGYVGALPMNAPEAAALERADLVRDERFATRDLRISNYGELNRVFAEIVATKPRAHWVNMLEEHDVPFAPVNSIADVLDDPQVRHLRTFYRQRHPTEGEITAIHRPVLIDGARDERALPAPALGEHTDAVLAELGYDQGEIAKLRAAAVI